MKWLCTVTRRHAWHPLPVRWHLDEQNVVVSLHECVRIGCSRMTEVVIQLETKREAS